LEVGVLQETKWSFGVDKHQLNRERMFSANRGHQWVDEQGVRS